jgi:hypothetical protein
MTDTAVNDQALREYPTLPSDDAAVIGARTIAVCSTALGGHYARV